MHVDAVERHHAPVEHVSDLALHLHVDVFDEHAVYDGESLEIDGKLLELLGVVLEFVGLDFELDIYVGLVATSLLLEASDHFFDVFLNGPELCLGQQLRFLDIPINLIVQLSVFMDHFVFEFADLRFDHLVGFIDLLR